MDATGEILCGMYKNVKTASENVVSALPKVEDRFLVGELTADLEGYSSFAKNIEDMMHERGLEPSPPGFLSKIGAKAGVALNTMINSTPSHIAKIYMDETKEAARQLESIKGEAQRGCDGAVLALCEELIEKERQNAAKMEAFL